MTPLEEWLMEETKKPDCPPHLHNIYNSLFAKVSIYDVVLRLLLLPWQLLSGSITVAFARADAAPASAAAIAERRNL